MELTKYLKDSKSVKMVDEFMDMADDDVEGLKPFNREYQLSLIPSDGEEIAFIYDSEYGDRVTSPCKRDVIMKVNMFQNVVEDLNALGYVADRDDTNLFLEAKIPSLTFFKKKNQKLKII